MVKHKTHLEIVAGRSRSDSLAAHTCGLFDPAQRPAELSALLLATDINVGSGALEYVKSREESWNHRDLVQSIEIFIQKDPRPGR